MSDTPPINGTKRTKVEHAFHARSIIAPIEIALFRSGPEALFVAVAEKQAQSLAGLHDSPKYAAFLRAAQKHGVKIVLSIAVEEPISETTT